MILLEILVHSGGLMVLWLWSRVSLNRFRVSLGRPRIGLSRFFVVIAAVGGKAL